MMNLKYLKKITNFIKGFNSIIQNWGDVDEDDLWEDSGSMSDEISDLFHNCNLSKKELSDIIQGARSGIYNIKDIHELEYFYDSPHCQQHLR
jgi:hypothetical protein